MPCTEKEVQKQATVLWLSLQEQSGVSFPLSGPTNSGITRAEIPDQSGTYRD